jgi:beta-ketodecanoyl-[acyl-carrier-protein] synthase
MSLIRQYNNSSLANSLASLPFLTGIGVYLPPDTISNEELVTTFNRRVETDNAKRAIIGEPALPSTESGFILEASGIRNRHVLDKTGILDPARMVPNLAERLDDALSIQAEFAVSSARLALADAGLSPSDIDLVICSCAHHQRPYPAIAIEIQKALGCRGAAFDMNVACSSTTFAMHLAAHIVRSGAASNVLVCSPEIMSGHLNHLDRKSHFIFGDASVSVIISNTAAEGQGRPRYEILKSDIWTEFSSNIRSNFGFLNRTSPETAQSDDKLVTQVGNKVFKDIVFAASRHIKCFLHDTGMSIGEIHRLWLHQANLKMLRALVKHLGSVDFEECVPIILDEIGNVASPGSLIAFARTRDEVPVGAHGLLCSFGAGYSIGCLLLKRIS